MKKIAFMLVVLSLGLQAMAQKGQPILPYGDYSIQDVKKFALGDSIKSQEFRNALIPLVQRKLNEVGEKVTLSESNVCWIFDHVVEQETWLEAGQFKNSRWYPDKKKLDFYVSETRYEGAAGIFKYGKCSFPLYKVSCANLLDASLNKVVSKEKPVDHTIQLADTVYNTVYKNDTVFKRVWVDDPRYYERKEVRVVYVSQPDPYYVPVYQPMIMYPFLPISCYPSYGWGGGGHSDVYIDNSSYYYSNTTNNYNKHITTNGKPGGAKIDTGKPGGAGTDGGGLKSGRVSGNTNAFRGNLVQNQRGQRTNPAKGQNSSRVSPSSRTNQTASRLKSTSYSRASSVSGRLTNGSYRYGSQRNYARMSSPMRSSGMSSYRGNSSYGSRSMGSSVSRGGGYSSGGGGHRR